MNTNEPSAVGCCAPARGSRSAAEPRPVEDAVSAGAVEMTMVRIPGGEFWMGTDDPDGFAADGEGPVRSVRVSEFELAAHAVTYDQFAQFVAATGYVSDAERFGWSFVFAGFLPAALRRGARRPEATPWWCAVDDATWRTPEGPGSVIGDRGNHPVVHVSWHDAEAYCHWAQMRLPTETEWEYAARGGLDRKRYPWGDELTPGGEHHCNIWQGAFPIRNSAADGYRGAAPVDAFPANGFGLHSMVGNVWEWCSDWWSTDHDPTRVVDPRGPRAGTEKVIRGGSYLCHDSYCNRYRVAARTRSTPDSTTGNTGFRCARDTGQTHHLPRSARSPDRDAPQQSRAVTSYRREGRKGPLMSNTPKNVLVIMSDQHNPKILGAAGNPLVRTPNLDALAAAGTRFDNAYCASPICVPSRASFATGLYPHQTRHWDNAMGYDGAVDGWGHELQHAGRRVESIGKLHYRNETDPTGFDCQHLPMHLKDGIGQVWGSVRDPLPRRDNAPLMVTISGGADSDYTRYDAAVTDRTCRWLQEETTDEKPWVLYAGLLAPHFPYLAPPEFFALYDPADMPHPTMRPEDGHQRHPWVEAFAGVLPGLDGSNTEEERRRAAAAYYGLVSSLDHNIGRILDALETSGHAEDTLVVYTSDHGDMVGSRGLWGKSLLYQESAGIPMIMRGPGVPAGKVSHTPTSLVDMYSTILDAAEVTPVGEPRPGRSLLEIARSEDDSERVVFSEYHAMGAPSGAFMIRKGRHVLHHYVGYAPELFDMTGDPDQTRDLAADPQYAEILADLERELGAILDPDVVDKQAKADQAALIASFGGPEAAAAIGTPGETPPPAPPEQP